ncbi:unannotated protein [freshwater metagenome]|uniref:Unannotated protein n=1 Tax=freshwater metagenome TaxID=449393 RepID=A0A6J6P0C3_9ZZZZ
MLYPFVRPGAMFEGAVEVRGSADKFGLDPIRVAGTWQAICDRAREFVAERGRVALISHEVLAGASPEQVGSALAALDGLEVHVVVTARDLGRQCVAHWQEQVKLGDTRSFADLTRDELLADTGRDLGPDAGGVRPHFWHAQDFADTLARWGAGLPPERTHLVVCPAPGAAAGELWTRFAAGAGIDARLVDPATAVAANASLGAEQIALLREVNRLVGDRLPRAERQRVVKREYAERELAAVGAPPPRAPAALAPMLGDVTAAWMAEVIAAGRRVHGDPDDLRPVLAGPHEPPPDVDLPAGADPARVADELVGRGRTAGP